MSLNKVLLIGNVGKDPEIRFVSDNLPVARFSVATSKKGFKTSDGKEVPGYQRIGSLPMEVR